MCCCIFDAINRNICKCEQNENSLLMMRWHRRNNTDKVKRIKMPTFVSNTHTWANDGFGANALPLLGRACPCVVLSGQLWGKRQIKHYFFRSAFSTKSEYKFVEAKQLHCCGASAIIIIFISCDDNGQHLHVASCAVRCMVVGGGYGLPSALNCSQLVRVKMQ